MRVGLWVALTLFALGALVARARAQEPPTGSEVSQIAQSQPELVDPRIEQMQTECLPDTFRAKLLIWCVSCSFMVAFSAYLSRKLDWQQIPANLSCAHCMRTHRISGSVAVVCDALTSSSFFYLAALPFMAAVRGQAFDVASIGITALLGVALIMALIVLGTLVSLMNTRKTQGSQNSSGFLIGLRIASFLVSIALLSGGASPDAVSASFDSIFGPTLGQRLINAIGAGPILDTSLVLIVSVTASCLLRWVFPFIAGSRPLALTRSGESLHKPIQLARS